MDIKEYTGNGTFKYDSMGQYIWLVEKNGNHIKFADLRGWGNIQYLPEFKYDLKAAAKFQDSLGEWVVETLNARLNDERFINLSKKP